MDEIRGEPVLSFADVAAFGGWPKGVVTTMRNWNTVLRMIDKAAS